MEDPLPQDPCPTDAVSLGVLQDMMGIIRSCGTIPGGDTVPTKICLMLQDLRIKCLTYTFNLEAHISKYN